MEKTVLAGHLRRTARKGLRLAAVGSAVYLVVGVFLLALYGIIWPPVSGVQVQRRIEGVFGPAGAGQTQVRTSIEVLDRDLLHAVVAAEDARFYQHHGIDPQAVREAIEDTRGGRRRGGSTITQQLVKNLLMTTRGGWLRKLFEVPLTLAADLLLTKERQLELYLNVAEWGPGIYGAEAAAQHHLSKSARRLTREEAAGLASLLPAPRTRTIARTVWYRSIILRRMDQMGY